MNHCAIIITVRFTSYLQRWRRNKWSACYLLLPFPEGSLFKHILSRCLLFLSVFHSLFFSLSVFVLLSLPCSLFQSPSPHFLSLLSFALPPSPLNNLDFTVYLPTAKHRFIPPCTYAKQRVWTLELYLWHWSLVFACNNYSTAIMGFSIVYTHAVSFHFLSFSLFVPCWHIQSDWEKERKSREEKYIHHFFPVVK